MRTHILFTFILHIIGRKIKDLNIIIIIIYSLPIRYTNRKRSDCMKSGDNMN